ncbi:restriction endonuclease subunit S [Paenibacillus alvei]|uniref:restriction endonuclease subunit S n=1 Tax=Paenibacillus alvei TaxID=44250 RepID=UPI003D2719DC
MTERINLVPKRRFKEFQNTRAWEQRKLGEVADIIGGGTPSTSNEEYWNGDIDWYSPVEIGELTYIDSSQKKITELGLQKSSAKILPIGTVLFTSRAGIGNTAILAKEGATNQGFQSIVPHRDKLDSYFIYSRTHELKRYGEINGAGSTFLEVSGKQMAKMPMLIPILKEQKKIGGFFERLDYLIAIHQRKLEKTKALKSAYLSEMFPAEGEREPKRRFAGFTQTWEQEKLSEVTDVYDGTHQTPDYKNEGIMFLSVENIKTLQSKKYISKEAFESEFKVSPEKGDILMTRIGDIGTANVVESDEPIGYYVSLALLKKKKLNSYFLQASIHSPAMQGEIYKRTLHIAFPKKINKNEVEDVPIRFPNDAEQTKIGDFFKSLDYLIALHQRKLEKLRNIKKAYLHEMFV